MQRNLALPSSSLALGWGLPLRLGFLSDAGSRALRALLEAELDRLPALRRSVQATSVEETNTVDFLAVPAPLGRARELLLASPAAVLAPVLLLFDRSPDATEAARGPIAGLRQLTQALGVGMAPVRPGQEATWLLAVLAKLLRGGPLDTALDIPDLFDAGRHAVLYAEPALLAAFARPTRSSTPMREAPEPFKGPSPDGYGLELETAVTRSPEPRQRPGRFLQTRVSEGRRPSPGVRAGRRYEIAVWIGPPEAESLRLRERFPEEKLPENAAGHLLTVVLSEPHLLDGPLVQTIFLPRDGASSVASFPLDLPSDTRAVEARITVLYENRVLQTARFGGRVGERWDLASEMNVRPGLKNLSGQRRFDGALIVDDAGDGAPRVTAGAGYDFVTFSIAKLDQAVDEIEARINGTRWDDAGFASLDAPGSRDLLRYLARKGAGIYRELVRYAPASPLVVGDGPVQLVSAESGARIPLEFLYSRKSPEATAGLCPGWRQALATGTCDCPDDGSVVCPLGFWAFRRVLERHRFQPEHAEITGSRAYALGQAKGDGARLSPLRAAVLGASGRVAQVDSGALDGLLQKLRALSRGQIEPARGWKDWVRQIRAGSPSLLILLPHTALDGDDVPTLEISNDALASDHLEREHVLGPAGEPHPIVLLLGCNTDNAGLPFESFVPAFADQQAAVVVTSLSKILGRHAAPLAAHFVEQLAAFPQDGTHRIGEVMREVRRRSALAGPPLALVLKSYGDADWRI